MTEPEWAMLEKAATSLDWTNKDFKQDLEDLIQSLYTAAVD
jgi:hypothetical protein